MCSLHTTKRAGARVASSASRFSTSASARLVEKVASSRSHPRARPQRRCHPLLGNLCIRRADQRGAHGGALARVGTIRMQDLTQPRAAEALDRLAQAHCITENPAAAAEAVRALHALRGNETGG